MARKRSSPGPLSAATPAVVVRRARVNSSGRSLVMVGPVCQGESFKSNASRAWTAGGSRHPGPDQARMRVLRVAGRVRRPRRRRERQLQEVLHIQGAVSQHLAEGLAGLHLVEVVVARDIPVEVLERLGSVGAAG